MYAKDLDELIDAYHANSSMIDVIALSTTWIRLGKMGVSSSRPVVVDQRAIGFVRDALLSRTLARVPDMTVRQVSNVLWAMGKLRLKLAEEKNGPYLAEQIEARVLDLLQRIKTGGFKSPLDGSQLWLGLSMCQYEWSTGVLQELLMVSLAEMDTWDTVALASASAHIVKLCGDRLLRPEHKVQIKDSLVRGLFSDNSQAVQRTLSTFTVALHALQLPLAPSELKVIVSTALDMPLPVAEARGRCDLISTLTGLVDLGYQPSAHEAEAWLERLEDIGGEDWTSNDFTGVVWMLSRCKAYKPPPEMVERVVRAAQACQTSIEAKRILGASHTWRIPLPDTTYSRLKQRADVLAGRGSRAQGESGRGGRGQGGGGPGGGGRGRGSAPGRGRAHSGRGRGDRG